MAEVSTSHEPADPLLRAAREGSAAALGSLMQAHQGYLLAIAQADLPAQLHGKVGASDIVQETFLEAQRIFPRFTGDTLDELKAWLRAVLKYKTAEQTRHFLGTVMRDAGREVAFGGIGEGSDFRQAGAPDPSNHLPTPSQEMVHDEEAQAVRRALELMPPQYAEVIRWRQWEELSFEEIGNRIGKSPEAARMLWWRAVTRLQQEMALFNESSRS